jgi:predicted nucleic acid-binding protein
MVFASAARRAMNAWISSARQTVVPGPSLKGCGALPALTQAHHVVAPTGMGPGIPRRGSPNICACLTKPVSGSVLTRATWIMDFTVHLDGYERLHVVVIASLARAKIGTATHPYCRLLFLAAVSIAACFGPLAAGALSRPDLRRGYDGEPEGYEQIPSFTMPIAYMLDTNVFNHVLRDSVDVHTLRAGRALFVTHIQLRELQATTNQTKRDQLRSVFREILPSQVPTESAIWDVSEWDECKWGAEDGLFDHMLVALNRRNRCKENNRLDILIAETALRNGFGLVTDDHDLAEVFREFHGHALSLHEFLAAQAIASS